MDVWYIQYAHAAWRVQVYRAIFPDRMRDGAGVWRALDDGMACQLENDNWERDVMATRMNDPERLCRDLPQSSSSEVIIIACIVPYYLYSPCIT